jgi:CheY-like chemotaxis protein/HPt (histidine-containing phosphotransfer) domain-containing protein
MLGIVGMAQLLQSPDLTAAERSDYARMFAQHSQNLLELLCVSSPEPIHLEHSTSSPRQLLSEMLAINAERARRKGDALRAECQLAASFAECSSGDRFPLIRKRGGDHLAHILVAEDTPSHAKLLEIMLGKLGYRVSLASNGERAVDWVMHRDIPDLILMDCEMPVMDGLEATRIIRVWEKWSTRAQAVPIVALTCSFESDRQACLAAGMNDFLSKPFHFDDLKAVLDKLLHGAKSRIRSTDSIAGMAKNTAYRAADSRRHAPLNDPVYPHPINLPLALGRMGGDLETFLCFAAAVPAQMAHDHAAISEIALAAGCVGWSDPAPASQAADAKVLRKASHRLRGVFGMLGAERAQAACQALEVAARQHDGAAYPERIQELDAALAALRPALDDLLAHPAGHFSGH